MRIAFDATYAAYEKKTGIGVYVEQIVRNFQTHFPEDEITQGYKLSRWIKGRKNFVSLSNNSKRRVIWGSAGIISGGPFDIFHGLNMWLPIVRNAFKIITVHDLFAYDSMFLNEEFKKKNSGRLLSSIDRADHVIVTSRYMKGELIQKLRVPESRISVIAQGIGEKFLKEKSKGQVLKSLKENGIDKPFLLFVGNLERRKNILNLIKAFNIVKSKGNPELELILVGGEGNEFGEIFSEIENSPYRSYIRRPGFVSNDLVLDLYRGAKAFVFVSWEEGYGLPILEAMVSGVPVVSSNTTALPEVGGGFSFLVDPSQPEAIAGTIDRLLVSENLGPHLEMAKTYAQSKTWEANARNTRTVYEKCLTVRE